MPANWTVIVAGLESALVAVLANPAPNYSVNGQQVSTADYIAMLRRELAEAEKEEAASQGPWIINKRMF